MSRGKRAGSLAALALVAVGCASATAVAQQDENPLPPGLPDYNWQQMISRPATVWACKQRVSRHGDRLWRINMVAKSQETQWQVSAGAQLQRWPRKRTLDDWDSGILEPGEVSKVGRVTADVDNNDRLTIGAGHRNGPYEGMGLGDAISIRDLDRC
jgi:hypothetical protein